MSSKLIMKNYKLIQQLAQLTKFKLSILNGIVTVASYSLYTTVMPAWPLFISSVALSMSTQSMNQYIEVEYDRMMLRTCQRPLVLGMNSNVALGLGFSLGTLGILGLSTYNMYSAGLGIAIWCGYVFIYTSMKSKTLWNTMIGSIIGSLPVYLGWAASQRSLCMVEPFAIFIYMMAWQHQHFYGIRWIYYDDYNNAGFKMQKSKQVAAAIVILQIIISLIMVNYAIKYYQISNCWLLNIPLTLGLYYWGIKSALKFASGEINAKVFKIHSYKHFILVFGVLLICRVIGNSNQNNINIKKRNRTILKEQLLSYTNCI